MIPEYLDRLSPELQHLVHEIENKTTLNIDVEVRDCSDDRAHDEVAPLACIVNESEIRLLVPRGNAFLDGSVLHELLHVERFLIEGIPTLTVLDAYCSPDLELVFAQVDNNLEHLVIVPREIRQLPDQRQQWKEKIARSLNRVASSGLQTADRDFLAIYHLSFIALVLHDEGVSARARALAASLGLTDRAERFAAAIAPALAKKEDAVQVLVDAFRLDPSCLCLQYFNSKERSSLQVPLSQVWKR